MANSVDLDEVAHYEPPHQDLRCLQIQLLSSLVVKELTHGILVDSSTVICLTIPAVILEVSGLFCRFYSYF